MGTDLILGVRLTGGNFTTIKLNDIDLKTKVEGLRLATAEQVELPQDSFELIYCGCVLEDHASLESCGLKNGSMVHVLKKKETEKPIPAKSITQASIIQLANAFRSFNENPALRSALHRLSKRPEVIENIILTTPGLSDDSVAIAMLQDPDLMAHFTDPDTVRRIAELHPVLVEAAQLIAAAVHEEAHSTAASASTSGSSTAMNAPSTAYSYSLDNLSDDEEMAGDSSQSSDSNAAITAAQLAAALSRASARSGFPLSHSSSSTSAGSMNSGVITTEMFSQAIQQAFGSASTATAAAATGGGVGGGGPPISPILPQPADLQRQLALMHEMGLQDDAVNIQALQFTNGDVQAAIELVFTGFSDN